MPKGTPRVNLALEEAEIKKIEENNRRRKKALEEAAELLRQERDLAKARGEGDGGDGDERAVTGLISEQFADILQGLEEDGKFWVFRIDERGRSAQCGAWPVADWPSRMEEIAHDSGGGTFKIQFKTATGQFVKQTTMTFDPKFYGKKENGTDAANPIMALMLAQAQEARREAADARRENGELMKTVMAALLTPRDGGFIKNAQDIAAIGALFKGNSGGDPIQVLKTGIELGMQMGEGKEPPSTLDKVLETIAGPAAGLLARLQAPAPAPAPRLPAPATMPRPVTDAPPAPAAPPPEAPAPVDEKAAVKLHPFYKTYVPKVLEAAKAGADVKEWAEYITDMIPAVYHPQLLELLQKPDLVEFLGSYEPEARNFAVWIVGVRDEINKLFPPEEIPAGKGSLSMTPAPLKADGTIDGVVPQALVDALNE